MERDPNPPNRHELIATNHRLETAWRLEAANILTITETLGMPIDQGIQDTVVALRLLRFPTMGSCAGHDAQAVNAGPYVDIYTPTADRHVRALNQPDLNQEQRDSIINAAAAENAMTAVRLSFLLRPFYEQHRLDPSVAIATVPLYAPGVPIQNGVRLWTAEAMRHDAEQPAERVRDGGLAASQREFDLFTDYLVELLAGMKRI